MRIRSLLLTSALAACSFTIANAKTYHVVLSEDSKAGPVELKAGEYRLKVEGANAIFTSVDDNRSFTAPVRVENSDQKFEQTAVQTNNANGEPHVEAIEIGGSRTVLEFGK